MLISSQNPESAIAIRLLRAVIAKSFIEILLVCVVATLAAFSNFSPRLRGAIDVADQTRIAGWVYDPASPEEKVEVQLFINGDWVATGKANERRDDLVAAGAARTPDHGFTFPVAPLKLFGGNHTVQVYAVRRASGNNKSLIPLSHNPSHFQSRR
jgi:hypothetical protein